MTLNIPQRRDPIARFGLFGLIAAVIWVAIASATQPTPTAAQSEIILMATATPLLPTPAQDTPALAVAVPTPQGWLDQALGHVGVAADQMADNQAALLAQEQAAAQAAAQAEAERLAAEQAARDQYLANVGAQAAHSPRGDVSEPPPSQTGPIQYSDNNGTPYIVAPAAPAEQPPAAPAIAVAVPAISQEQAAVIGARESNGCPDGQVFYPRTGCHTPGSGGPQPGAIGEGK